MKNLIIILTLVLSLQQASSQETSYPRLSFEIGAGYEYAMLKSFNSSFITGDEHQVFKSELHSGYSINFKAPFQFNRFIDLGTDFSIKQFRKKNNTPVLITSPNHVFIGANHYEKTVILTTYEGGFSSSFWLSECFQKLKDSKISFGLDAIAAYGIVRFKNIKSYTYPDDSKGYSLGLRAENDYFRFGGGVDLKYDLNYSVLESMIVKVGYTQIVGSFDDIDTGGFYTKLLLRLGKG